MEDPVTGERRQRGVDSEAGAVRQVGLDPAVGDDARVGLRQLAGVADRPREGHDEQQQRHRGERTQPAGQRAERREQR